MEKDLKEKAPGLKIVTPGLSIKVEGMKGPIADGELDKCEGFANRIVAGIS